LALACALQLVLLAFLILVVFCTRVEFVVETSSRDSDDTKRFEKARVGDSSGDKKRAKS